MTYKILYFVGNEVDIKAKGERGVLSWQAQSLVITGQSPFVIPFASCVSVEMFRLYGLSRMIKLVCKDRTIFLAVIRFSLGGYFASVNYFKTGELFERLKTQLTLKQ